MKKLLALCVVSTVLTGAFSVSVLAGPPKKEKKVVDVWHCPMTGEEVKDKKDKGTVVGKYRAHFCCAGCPESFAKLSKKDQEVKIKEAAKKDADDKKKG